MKQKKRDEASFVGVSIAMFATIVARGTGFVRELLLAQVFGTSASGDALVVALNIPNTMVSGFALALSTIYIPTYHIIKQQNEGQHLIEKINYFFLVTLFVLSSTVILGVELVPGVFVTLFASGFDNNTFELCVILLRITIIATLPILYSSFFCAFGQIINKYGLLIFASGIINILMILTLLFVHNNPIIVVAAMFTSGYMAYLIITIVVSCKSNQFKLVTKFDIKNKYVKHMLISFVPVFVSNIVTDLNQMIDKNFASTLSAGTISALNYSSKLINLITAVFGTAIASVLFSKLSKIAAEDGHEKLSREIIKLNSYLISLVLPVFWTVFFFSRWIVTFLYGHGSFDTYSIEVTSQCLIFYSLGIIGFNLKALWVRCYNASLNTKTPAINSSIAVALNIILNILLIGVLKHRGLALATTIASLCTDFLLICSYKKTNSQFSILKCFIALIQPVFLSLIYVVSYITVIKKGLPSNLWLAIIEIIICFSITSIIYILFLVIFKIPIGKKLYSVIKREEKKNA